MYFSLFIFCSSGGQEVVFCVHEHTLHTCMKIFIKYCILHIHIFYFWFAGHLQTKSWLICESFEMNILPYFVSKKIFFLSTTSSFKIYWLANLDTCVYNQLCSSSPVVIIWGSFTWMDVDAFNVPTKCFLVWNKFFALWKNEFVYEW